MADITITVTNRYEVPDGSKIVKSAATGDTRGIRLPSGELLVPWIALEKITGRGEQEQYKDLSDTEMTELDVHTELDIERTIEYERRTTTIVYE